LLTSRARSYFSQTRIFMQNRIGVLRRERGLSLADLAKAAGTTKAQIQKLERGDRRLSLEWMERLAAALGVKASDLLPESAVSCQHGPEEREILEIVSRLPLQDRITIVRIAAELMATLRRLEEGEGKLGDLPFSLDMEPPRPGARRRRA
jgi:transcriptional regulator with XRE-family HTH domain